MLFSASGPSDMWFRKLEQEHPEIRFRTARTEDACRSRMSNSNVLDEFFVFWNDQLTTHGLTDKPAQVNYTN